MPALAADQADPGREPQRTAPTSSVTWSRTPAARSRAAAAATRAEIRGRRPARLGHDPLHSTRDTERAIVETHGADYVLSIKTNCPDTFSHQSRRLHHRLRARREGQHRHHLLAARVRAGVELRTRCRVRRSPAQGWHGGRRESTTMPTASSMRSRRKSSSLRATASARRGCCSTRSQTCSRTVWRTAVGWSART